jgi:hyaluronan synthase
MYGLTDIKRAYLSVKKVWLAPFLSLLVVYVVYRTLQIATYVNYELLVIIGLCYTLAVSLVIFGRFALAFSYRPAEVVTDPLEPSVTVVIPVKNEEACIADTVTSVLNSDYPLSRLDVIVVNDGSTDGTQGALEALLTWTNRLTVEKFESNRGKRAALEFGFMHARGEVVVVLDSDTTVRRDCIREVVRPLSDVRVGGVSGHTDVRDPKTRLEKMQGASYFPLYHLSKKAEAKLGMVTCLPGCASAYRKTAILPILHEWRHQKFLGAPCTVGEDRGLTTFLLRDGWRTVYTPTAVAETRVPTRMNALLKQRLRWKRSYYREAVLQSQFMHRRWGALYYYPFIATSLMAPLLALVLLFIAPFVLGPILVVEYIAGIVLVSFLYSAYSKLYRRRFAAHWLAAWSVFNLFVLNFLSIYAMATLTDGRWGTR